ncbi:MAG TPA: tetratricopeptide repeat protein [Vicinamibacterales bacterium]|nr:tetratricopeptide repeat protein [Vicinamibacterales bacterium]
MKRAILAALLLGVSLAVAYGYIVTNRDTRHRDLIDQGDAAMAEGDLATAIEAFSGAIALKSDSMIGYLKRGDAYRRRDELEAALRDLKQAAEIDPSAPRPRELLGDVNYARHRFGPAAGHYEAYVDLDDSSPRVLYKLALARYRDGQGALGVAALTRAVELDNRFAEAYYLLALCQREAQRPGDALASLKKAIDLAPAMLQAREARADLFTQLGRPEEALAELEVLRALDQTPQREVDLGLAYSAAGQTDRAVLTLRHAAERNPGYGYTFVALGRVWLETAQARSDRIDLGKAIEALSHAVSPDVADPGSEAYMLYGRALLLASDVETAERMLQQATQKLPVEPLAFFYLGEAAERRGHFDLARRSFIDYLALVSEEPDSRRSAQLCSRIADLSMREGDYATAITYYERAAPTPANDPDAVVRLAEAQWRSGELETAKALVDRVIEKDPSHPAARALLRRMR